AGVDFAYAEAPQRWLADPEAERAVAPAPTGGSEAPREAAPPPLVGGDPAGWPQDLAAFRRWWLEEPTLDRGGLHPRVAPRGAAGAPLMMLVPMPEEGDGESLLQGPQGRLLASLASAMGLAPDRVYFAAALPRHTAMPDWGRIAAEGYGEVLLHHIRLAGPRRVMILGRDVLPLVGHGPAQAAPFVGELAIQGRQVPLMASYAPSRLLASARWRAQLWRGWLDWTAMDSRGVWV